MSTTLFVQQLVTGLSIGGIYALLAVGYALIYSIFKFTNFAFGAIMMCAAYGAYFMVHELKMTSLLSGLFGAIVVGVLVSVATEIVAYRSLRKMKASRLFLMISAMGVNILIQNFMTIMMSANLRSLNCDLPFRIFAMGKIRMGALDIFSLLVSLLSLLILGCSSIKQNTASQLGRARMILTRPGLWESTSTGYRLSYSPYPASQPL